MCWNSGSFCIVARRDVDVRRREHHHAAGGEVPASVSGGEECERLSRMLLLSEYLNLSSLAGSGTRLHVTHFRPKAADGVREQRTYRSLLENDVLRGTKETEQGSFVSDQRRSPVT